MPLEPSRATAREPKNYALVVPAFQRGTGAARCKTLESCRGARPLPTALPPGRFGRWRAFARKGAFSFPGGRALSRTRRHPAAQDHQGDETVRPIECFPIEPLRAVRRGLDGADAFL